MTTVYKLHCIKICNKYITPATSKALQARKRTHRKSTATFPMHIDTAQFRDNAEWIADLFAKDEIEITISEKCHGSSHRYGYTLDDIEPNVFQNILKKVGFKIKPKQEYKYMSGTRRVILRGGEVGYYKNEDFRHNACLPFYNQLRKGELVYFEIVGWAGTNERIMGPQDTTKLKDGLMCKLYGDKMEYNYNCKPGEFDVYVYRIAMVNPDGFVIDLPWKQVKERCYSLGVKHTPELYNNAWLVKDCPPENLVELVTFSAVGPSVIDKTHIREGVVIRVDDAHGTRFFKYKSFEFGVLEGYLKEQDDYVDMEEAA